MRCGSSAGLMSLQCQLAIAAIAALSLVNFFGVKPGSRVLNVLVVLKVSALALIIVAGAIAPASPGWWSAARTHAPEASTVVAFGAALVPILFAYGGWQNANYIAEEIDNPRRNLPLSLLAGTTAVVAIYVTVNIVYLRALGLEGLAGTTTPASKAAAFMFGTLGDRFVTAAIAISTFGFLDLAILAPTRVYYAMAADRVFFPALSRLHPKYQTPWIAIVIQSTWSCVLAVTGRYEQLLNYVVFADWIFFGLTVATVIVFRRSHPLSQRAAGTFQAPGFPLIQLAFVAVAAGVRAERGVGGSVKRLARRGSPCRRNSRCSTLVPAACLTATDTTAGRPRSVRFSRTYRFGRAVATCGRTRTRSASA